MSAQILNSNQSLSCSDSIKVYTRQWANIGLGNSTDQIFNSLDGINLSVDYHWMPKRITYQAGLNVTSEILDGPTLNVLNAGIGKSLIFKRFLFSGLAGPAIMWGKNYDVASNQEMQFVKPGLTISVEVIIKVIKNLGLGLEFYTNLNEVQNAAGVRLVLHLNNDK